MGPTRAMMPSNKCQDQPSAHCDFSYEQNQSRCAAEDGAITAGRRRPSVAGQRRRGRWLVHGGWSLVGGGGRSLICGGGGQWSRVSIIRRAAKAARRSQTFVFQAVHGYRTMVCVSV